MAIVSEEHSSSAPFVTRNVRKSQLYHAKSNSYFGETRDRVSRLLRVTIQTGFLTFIVALPIGPLYFRVQSSTTYALSYATS
jgi:hypothetical protein